MLGRWCLDGRVEGYKAGLYRPADLVGKRGPSRPIGIVPTLACRPWRQVSTLTDSRTVMLDLVMLFGPLLGILAQQ